MTRDNPGTARDVRGCVVDQETGGTTLFHCADGVDLVTFNLENFEDSTQDAVVNLGIGITETIRDLAIVRSCPTCSFWFGILAFILKILTFGFVNLCW